MLKQVFEMSKDDKEKKDEMIEMFCKECGGKSLFVKVGNQLICDVCGEIR